MATNDFLPFATAPTANVLSQTVYTSLLNTEIASGFQTGIAQSSHFNKVWRQSSIMAASVAQAISDSLNVNVTDDGTTATIVANLKAAAMSNRTVNTLSDLTTSPSTGTPVITVLGDLRPGDGGFGIYAINTSDVATGAAFTASITGTALTVTSIASGALAVGQSVYGTGVAPGTTIVSGSNTVWTVSQAQTAASTSMSSFAVNTLGIADIVTALDGGRWYLLYPAPSTVATTPQDSLLLPEGQQLSLAIAALQSALDEYATVQRVQYQEALTNQTLYLNPTNGQVSVLATANVTTDVQSQINTIQQTVNADAATLATTVTQLNSTNSSLTTAQSQIAQLSNQLTLTASQTYVDNAVGSASSGQTNSVASAALQSALDEFTQGQAVQNLNATVALVQSTAVANATALQAEVVARSALVAQVASNAAGIVTESVTRASADSSLASQITTLTATVNSNTAAILTEATTRANADNSLASEITTLTATVNSNTAAIGTESTTRANADSSLATQITNLSTTVASNTSAITTEATTRANADSALSTELSALTTTVNSNTAAILTEQTTRANADSALSDQINTISAATVAPNQTNAGQTTVLSVAAIQTILDEFTQGQTIQNIGINVAIAQSTTQAVTTALQAEVAARSALVSQVASNAAAITSESTIRASADSALASEITSLTATVNSNTSAITTEATTRANADSTLASEINTVQSALKDANGNLISSASVQTTANTALSNANQALASWTVKVNTNSAGKQYVGGLELVSGGSSGTQFAISADQLVLYMPDGTIPAGQTGPVPVMEIGTVNGVSTLGFNGALAIDGSITARSINSNNLTIRDGAGNIILGAGTPLSLGNISGLGAFATLGQINTANVTTYIANGAIGTAQIANAAIGTAQIANAAIGSAQIANAAITSAQIAEATISSLNIASGAVIVPVYGNATNSFDTTTNLLARATPSTSWSTVLSGPTLTIGDIAPLTSVPIMVSAAIQIFNSYSSAVEFAFLIDINNIPTSVLTDYVYITVPANSWASIPAMSWFLGNANSTVPFSVLATSIGTAQIPCTINVDAFAMVIQR